MKKAAFLLISSLLSAVFLGGCGDKVTADKYLGEQITSIKEGEGEALGTLLDAGAAKSNGDYVIQFPEDLKPAYTDFLQEALDQVEFKVSSAEKNGDDSYTVRVSFSPLNIKNTTSETNASYLETLDSSELGTEVTALLEQDAQALKDSPFLDSEVYATVEVQKTEEGFQVPEDEMQSLLAQALPEYMTPYDEVCSILDMQAQWTAMLDMLFKGDFSRYAVYENLSEEEVKKQYDEIIEESFPDDLDSKYKKRYLKAIKSIYKQCRYSVGIPRKEEGMASYTIDFTVTPNTSIASAMKDLQKGTYYSEAEVYESLLDTLEKYGKKPTYGKETVISVPVNLNSLLASPEDNNEFTKLAETILVSE